MRGPCTGFMRTAFVPAGMAALAACNACQVEQRSPPQSAAHVPATPQPAPVAAREATCAELSNDQIEHGTEMAWLEPERAQPGYASVIVSLDIEDEQPPSFIGPALTRYVATRRTEAEFATLQEQVERERGTIQPLERLRIEVADAQGVRPFSVEGGLANDTHRPMLMANAFLLIRPETQRIRVLLDGKLLEELTRPAAPPKVEAVILSRAPLQLAVRMRGATHLTTFSLLLRRPDGGHILQDTGTIEPGGPGESCWRLLPAAARPAPDDPALPVELRISNVFSSWSLRAE